jgi:hypothetical protein
MKTRSRDDFSQSVKRTLAHRVGLHCSNPDCDADTSGPQSDPSKSINVGVAAHITAASAGGPRFDSSMTEKERRSALNGIWVCGNCARLIDSDSSAFTREILLVWKNRAEQRAKARIGKTRGTPDSRSHKQIVEAIQREHKMRDNLHRDLLKSPPERMSLPRFTNRSAKFAHSEVIIHRIDDASYPNREEGVGISGWFLLEVLDFYHGGLHGILNIEYVLLDSVTKSWARLNHEQFESPFAARFSKAKVFKTGNIPWRNILHYDMKGDEFYPQPHIYCAYADAGMPYEGFGFFLLGNGYEQELYPENQTQLPALLALAESQN